MERWRVVEGNALQGLNSRIWDKAGSMMAMEKRGGIAPRKKGTTASAARHAGRREWG